jgi:hypothetical protein
MCRLCYNRDTIDLRKAQRRRYYLRHRERLQAKHSEYYHKNRERCRVQQRAYYLARNGKVSTATYGPELIRVPVKGWGCLNAST